MAKPYLKIIRINASVTAKPNPLTVKRSLITRKTVGESVRSLKKLGTLDYSLGQARIHLVAGAKQAKASAGMIRPLDMPTPNYRLEYHRSGIFASAEGARSGTLIRTLRRRIQETRRSRRSMYLDSRWVGESDLQVQRCAGVFTKPGTIFNLLQKKRAREVYKSKKPESPAFHIGVEIEFCSPESSDIIGPALVDAGLAKHVQLKGDGSVHPNSREHFGHEIAIVAPAHEMSGIIRAVSNVLRSGGAYVNKSCGLHVHLDQRGREMNEVERSFQNLVACQKILFAMLPTSRRDNQYCRTNRVRTFKSAANGERYHAVNATAYYKYKTLEIRMHSATIDADKICNWIGILKSIHDAPVIGRVQTLRGLAKQVGLASGLETYARARIEAFGGADAAESEAS